MFESVDEVASALEKRRYVAGRDLAVAVFLALKLQKPLLLEGEAGVGKTEVAKVLADMLSRPLIRLQGYEGIDVSTAVYEWNYARQIMAIRTAETFGTGEPPDVFGPEFLIKRPLLQAIEAPPGQPVVLLIDELDRADDEFEAFLLETLSDFQITIPEIGTIRSQAQPLVVITSNRTRELHEALKRRCLYHWIGFPSPDVERRVLELKAPEAAAQLRAQVVRFVQELRAIELYKLPGMSETIDWATGLMALGHRELSEPAARETLGLLLKNQEDVEQVSSDELTRLVAIARED